ncbi:hypothetical protein EDD11_001944 [Mortierella claussenii]|nr:hypothetical protein EDD11_001944 [Mortierella claussenii]
MEAKVHMLVLPRKRIEKLDKLAGSDGIRTVNQLVDRANWLLERLKKDSPHLTFKMGFHVIPSILQLHMHVISQDFCSDALKKKHHWNSFTSRFFISPDQVIKTLQERHTFTLTKKELDDYEGLLKMPLKCNQCNESPKNMPALKKHLEQHFFRLNG